MKGAAPAVALLLALGACGQKNETPAEPAPAAAPSQAKASRTVAYTCQGDMPVTAIYGTDADGNPDLALIIRGEDFRLTPTAAPEGRRFASPYGSAPGQGVIWWEKGDEVLLQQAPIDKISDPAAGVTARTCKVKTEPSAVPMARPPAG